MDVSQKMVNELFEQIDYVKDKEIPYGIFVLLGAIGSVIIIAGTILFEYFSPVVPAKISTVYLIGMILFILFSIAVYACFY